MAQAIRNVMTSSPATIESSATVVEAAKLMRDKDVGLLPVTEGGRLVGTITDRDITIRVVAESKDPQSTTVRDVASTDVVTLNPDQDFDEAVRLMSQHQVRRLPVVEDGQLVGIVAQADVATEGEDAKTGQLVQDISQ
jgi:CBS domain-containing protein